MWERVDGMCSSCNIQPCNHGCEVPPGSECPGCSHMIVAGGTVVAGQVSEQYVVAQAGDQYAADQRAQQDAAGQAGEERGSGEERGGGGGRH